MPRMNRSKTNERLIERDSFPFEFLSAIAQRESWRKEIHRPIYHVHKWWAKRLGSVFRGILLGCMLKEEDLEAAFYQHHSFNGVTVLDPFMGSGTTVGEAHKLGFTALGRDINPVAVEAVSVALGPIDQAKLQGAFLELSNRVGKRIRELYQSKDAWERPCDVLYYFWVMHTDCPVCRGAVDLFTSYVFARNAYPDRKPAVQIVCPSCGEVFQGTNGQNSVSCPGCSTRFNPEKGAAKGPAAICLRCNTRFVILHAVGGKRPRFRLYAKLVLTADGKKMYLRVSEEDALAYRECSSRLQEEVKAGRIVLPSLTLADGYNTRQALAYGFTCWRDFFNDRQLLALGYLRNAVMKIRDVPTRNALLTLFSGVLEFNNMFTSYKGEGTGAVRHMFSHHILKPERMPIEANVWGTPKSSGSFSNLFRTRLLRAIEYRQAPVEVNGRTGKGVVCSPSFSGSVRRWPVNASFVTRGTYISCGNSAETRLPDSSIDLVVTDPPFFDNVHYSELADFFFAWQQLGKRGIHRTTRTEAEVQDSDEARFATKLQSVFCECNRVLKDESLLVFTYHHSREDGWRALAHALHGAGFVVVNSHPVKSEMSVATPKSQAKQPIQLDIILVCRKTQHGRPRPSVPQALESAKIKLHRLREVGFSLSRNDCRVILFGQLLTAIASTERYTEVATLVEKELGTPQFAKMHLPLPNLRTDTGIAWLPFDSARSVGFDPND